MWILSDGCLCENCTYDGDCSFQAAVKALQKAASRMEFNESRKIYGKRVYKIYDVKSRIQIEECELYESVSS